MASYEVQLKSSLKKDFKSIPKTILKKVFSKFETLKSTPLPKGVVKLTGSERTYRLRVGSYRIIYEYLEEKKSIIIHYVRHRKEVYRNL